MGDVGDDRPHGDDAFEDPRGRGWFATTVSVVTRAVTGALAGIGGRPWPRQLPLDPPEGRREYRP